MERRIRGSGLRYTLPYVLSFAGLWLVVSIAAILVASASSYLVFADRMEVGAASGLGKALILQCVLSVLAVVALAVFTTHRIAGPWIAVRRALETVRDGDLEAGLRLRATDPRVHAVQVAFEEMLASLRQRLGEQATLTGEPASSGARAAEPPRPS